MEKAAFLGVKNCSVSSVYAEGRRERIESITDCIPGIIAPEDFESRKNELKDVTVIFSTWGMPHIKKEQLDEFFPKLKAVFYAAGTVRGFAAPMLEKGIKVFSAWAANALPVAEVVFSQIILANKGFFAISGKSREEQIKTFQSYVGNYRTKTGIIGAGMIGKRLIELLKNIETEVLVYDPYLSNENAEKLGVKKAELEEIFSVCDCISNHLPDIPETFGMLGYGHFSLMKPRAVFINSGRGRQVKEEELVRALFEDKSRFAVLDVTFPEPPEENSPLLLLDNILLTPHMDGSSGKEILRMADYMTEEFISYSSNKPCLYEVTEEIFKKMA